MLVKEKYGLRRRDMAPMHAHIIPFSAQTRMSGIEVDGSSIRKGAVDAVVEHVSRFPASRASQRKPWVTSGST